MTKGVWFVKYIVKSNCAKILEIKLEIEVDEYVS